MTETEILDFIKTVNFGDYVKMTLNDNSKQTELDARLGMNNGILLSCNRYYKYVNGGKSILYKYSGPYRQEGLHLFFFTKAKVPYSIHISDIISLQKKEEKQV